MMLQNERKKKKNNRKDRKIITHISGVNNPADLFTKYLSVIKVEKFRFKIRLG